MDDDRIEDTVMFSAANPAKPDDSMVLIKLGGDEVARTQALTGKDRFEHMVLYCLNILHKAGTGICAFYIDDFPDADEHTIRVLQTLIGKAGYTTNDFREQPANIYKGFWAWRKA
jgi:hypothetical protein